MHLIPKLVGVSESTRAHAERSDLEDVYKVVDVLIKNTILEPVPGRKLSQYKAGNTDLLAGLNWKELHAWIERKKKQILSLKCAVEGKMTTDGITDPVEEGDLSPEDAIDIDDDLTDVND